MATKNTFKECTRCIMNNEIDLCLKFDENGLCNHCRRYDQIISHRLYPANIKKQKFKEIITKIKLTSKGKKYNCIIGLSGGVDSSFVAYLLKKEGLNPLAVHLDNGWNSELAVMNIEKIISKLNIDLYTHVIDWNEFKDLQLSFLKASTPDGEVPSDHAINAILWKVAAKKNIKFIISGMNFSSESMSIPNWAYGHSDWKYIKGIHKIFGKSKLNTYPHYKVVDLIYFSLIKRIKSISILNYINYDKEEAMKILKNNLDWIYYGGKHYESIYTRFYQGYFLPTKFNIDKRYIHCSNLINSNQLTKEEAYEIIKKPTYSSELKNEDIAYVKKKLNITNKEFCHILKESPKSFSDYPNSYKLVSLIKKIVSKFRQLGIYPK